MVLQEQSGCDKKAILQKPIKGSIDRSFRQPMDGFKEDPTDNVF